MNRTRPIRAAALAVALMGSAPAVGREPPPPAAATIRNAAGAVTVPQADTVRLNFPIDSSLMTWVRFFAELRGMNFVIPNRAALEDVKVTIVSNQDVSPDAAWEAFLSALAVEGYTVELTAETAKIVQISAVRTGRLGSGQPADSDAWLTRLFTLGAVRAEDASELFSSLMGPDTKIVPHPPTNTLIVTGTAASVGIVQELLEGIDVPQPELTVERYELEFADPAEVERLIEQIYGPDSGIRVFVTPDR